MAKLGSVDMAVTINGTNTAQRLLDSALADFNTHCMAHDWTEAENARLRCVSHLESYLDGLRSVYKMMADQR